MGLFDRIIRNAVGSVVEKAVGEKVNDAVQGIFGDKTGAATAPAQPLGGKDGGRATPQDGGDQQFGSKANTQAGAPIGQTSGVKDAAYFGAIITSRLPQYQVSPGVTPEQLGGTGKPYTFGLYSDGTLKGVIQLVDHNRDRNRPYCSSREAAQAAGIPFINFYTHMPNEPDFVVGRIQRLALA
ncbi:MAG: hypothetical protein LBH11_02975 [Propionibacteriaceae bacterium]|jgi:hypothetical protein|nr:hypothetical protein [Propionibacteriaceae bacterium]